MDPNAYLKNVRENITAANAYGGAWNDYWNDAFNGMNDLYEWLKKGCFPPQVPDYTYISLGNGGPVSYSLLSIPARDGGGATFIRYEFSLLTGQFEESHKYACPAV